ncbi:MAG: DNA methylase [Lachnospiraceae bacterium]|nr:DNA methylase [Lachnospiraceae bacterium]
MAETRCYIAIDLKSFYASAECVDMGLDPLTANLVVADESRTEKTICLAVSPSLKSFGIPGRARLFEVVERVREVNAERLKKAPGRQFSGGSKELPELQKNPALKLEYYVARPRMQFYMQMSAQIYQIYLRYFAPEDIHVYSIDEVFIDATSYLGMYGMDGPALAKKLVQEVLSETGITATAGVGTNLYLSKIAMDVYAKHIPADQDGVRIAVLDQKTYRYALWNHQPITDFWRVGRGIARKLAENGMFTMGDVALMSHENEDLLYRLFGVNAELLIDHAWGYEPCRISDIRTYKPENNSVSSGQVLQHPYAFEQAKLIVREMTDALSLDLAKKQLVANQIVLTVCYDILNLQDPDRKALYKGPVETDRYGRKVPKNAHGTENLGRYTCSTRLMMEAVTRLYERIADPALLIRRIYVVANHVYAKDMAPQEKKYEQISLFTDVDEQEKERARENEALQKEKRIQDALLSIRDRYGKNAVLRGMNLQEGATMRDRNGQVGGHRA